jgi:hypothetical protein
MNLHQINEHMESLESRINRDGMSAELPSPIESLAMHLAVAVMYQDWYKDKVGR